MKEQTNQYFAAHCKLLLTLALLLMGFQTAIPQTKIDEYEILDSDSESARTDNFAGYLQNSPQSEGLIVIYSGENKERIGNILSHINGIKLYLTRYRGIDINQLTFIIARGKTPLFKELWIIEKGKKPPAFQGIESNLDNLKDKYLYGTKCLICEPSIPELSTSNLDLDLYIQTLEKNKNYAALIIVEKGMAYEVRNDDVKTISSKKYAENLKKRFVKENKIERNRIEIKVIPSPGDVARAYFYIVPQNSSKDKK